MAKIGGGQKKGGVVVVGSVGSNPVFPSRKIKNPYDGTVCRRACRWTSLAYQDGWEAGYEQAREDFEQ